MTSTTHARTAQDGAAPARPRPVTLPTFPRVLAAELTKITSLRSTLCIALATIAVSGALTWAAAGASSGDPGFVPLDSLTAGLVLTQVGPLVLGVLIGTGDFSTGTALTTYTAVPRRLPVLAAQTVATTLVALVVAAAAVGAAVVGLLPAAGSRGLTLDLTGAGTPAMLAGTVACLVGTALLGLALGALLRRPVPALVTAIGLLLVLPVVLVLASELATDPTSLPAAAAVPSQVSVVNTVVTLLPGGAGSLLAATPGAGAVEGAPDLGRMGGALVLAAWVLLPLAAAAVRLRTRDVVLR